MVHLMLEERSKLLLKGTCVTHWDRTSKAAKTNVLSSTPRLMTSVTCMTAPLGKYRVHLPSCKDMNRSLQEYDT